MLDITSKGLKPPYIIHSDLFKSFHFIKAQYLQDRQANNPLRLHFDLLAEALGTENLILPCFNYDFPRTKVFNTSSTPSQVGALSNFVLKNQLLQRTDTPIFSFLTNTPTPSKRSQHPFGAGSLFETVFQENGTIIFYGTEISSCTYLHFVEHQYGPPLYRYDKRFHGQVITEGSHRAVSIEMHVRPLGLKLNYNWNLLKNLLEEHNALVSLAKRCFAVSTKDLSTIWGTQLKKDPFKILTPETKAVIQKTYKKLGRRFQQSDFEDAA